MRGSDRAPDRARSAPVRSIRRRCRTAARRGPADRSAARSRVTARLASVSRSITSSRMPVACATRSQELVGIGGGAAGLGRDQPQPLGLAVPGSCRRRPLSAEMARSIAASLIRPLVLTSLAEPDDARERVDHAKAVAGRPGDQQAAIVGAEVERGIDAIVSVRRPGMRHRLLIAPVPPAVPRPARSRRGAAFHVSSDRLSAAAPADEEFIHGNFSSAGRRRNTITWAHAQSGVVVVAAVRYLSGSRRKRARIAAFQVICRCKITRRRSALDNAIALQKFGVGQPVRRKEDDKLVRGQGRYTDDFKLPGQAYAWIVRSPPCPRIDQGDRHRAAGPCPACSGSRPAPISPRPTTARSPAACR